jgi:phosphohistidine phosphatase
MQLILWRHCDAEDGVPDFSRRLTARGRNDASRMARWLAPRLPASARLLVSPAVRAQQTAAALQRKFETSAALAPGAAADDVLSVVGWPDGPEIALIVGHEPTLGEVVARLLDGEATGRPLRKGALVWLTQAAIDASVVLDHAVDPGTVGR